MVATSAITADLLVEQNSEKVKIKALGATDTEQFKLIR